MRNDWEAPPTVEGLIVRAWIGEDGQPDVLHVQGVDVADDIGNLDRVIGDPDNPDPDRPFVLVGKAGTICHSVRRPYLRQLKSVPFTQKFGHARQLRTPGQKLIALERPVCHHRCQRHPPHGLG